MSILLLSSIKAVFPAGLCSNVLTWLICLLFLYHFETVKYSPVKYFATNKDLNKIRTIKSFTSVETVLMVKGRNVKLKTGKKKSPKHGAPGIKECSRRCFTCVTDDEGGGGAEGGAELVD